MSAPFPEPNTTATRTAGGDPHADVFRPTNVIYIAERNEHVPSWYVPDQVHPRPGEVTVKIGGIPQGYTVATVPPERRWAIGPDGEVLEKSEFRPLYERKIDEFYRLVHGKQFHGSVKREYVPSPKDYVAVQVDPKDKRKLQPAGFDPDASRGARSKVLYDKDGENPIEGEDRLRMLAACYRDEKLKARLKDYELEEVEAYLREAGVGTVPVTRDDTAAALEQLTSLFQAGDITQEAFNRRVSALVGLAPVAGGDCKPEEPATEPERPAPALTHAASTSQARVELDCGAKVWPSMIDKHKDACGKCEPEGSEESD